MPPVCGSSRSRATLRILIFGINYAPEVAGIGPYTTGLAEHYASRGNQVSVVTGVPHYPNWTRGRFEKANTSARVRVIRANHFIPQRANAIGRCLYETSWLLSAWRWSLTRPADLALGVVPSLSGAFLASAAARGQRIPFGIIFQDLMGSAATQSGYRGGKRFARLVKRMELGVAEKASGIAIVAEGFREYFEGAGIASQKIVRVRNWAADLVPLVQRDIMRERLHWASDEIVCLHAGNMGQKQALDNVLHAAKLLEENGVKFVLAGDGNDRSRLLRKSKDMQITNVQFLPVQPPGLYESLLQAADILLVNQRASVSDMALPSKLASYFAAGRPVVAAAASQSEAAREVRDAGGIVVGPESPSQLAETCLDLKFDSSSREERGSSHRLYFDRNLNRPIALERYEDFIASVARGTGKVLGETATAN